MSSPRSAIGYCLHLQDIQYHLLVCSRSFRLRGIIKYILRVPHGEVSDRFNRRYPQCMSRITDETSGFEILLFRATHEYDESRCSRLRRGSTRSTVLDIAPRLEEPGLLKDRKNEESGFFLQICVCILILMCPKLPEFTVLLKGYYL